jgi:hypothetical protein
MHLPTGALAFLFFSLVKQIILQLRSFKKCGDFLSQFKHLNLAAVYLQVNQNLMSIAREIVETESRVLPAQLLNIRL